MLSCDELFEGAPTALSILFANHRERISKWPDLEHLVAPPYNVMCHSVFTDEYWQFFNPLDDDDAVTMDAAQHARAAATGAASMASASARSECPSNPHHDPFCGRYR
jgi:hypothetical protein